MLYHSLLRRIVLIPFLFIQVFTVSAQIPSQPVTFQSPGSSSLGLFSESPVSYFIGLPHIDLPLYGFSDNGINIPVGLSYHASGFRPDMHPGWVGLNWNMSTGFAIIRNVRDEPDDYHNTNHYYGSSRGYYFNRSVLSPSNWNQTAYIETIARTDNMLKDTEPDEFSFNYPGGSGKFYLDHNGNWKVQSNKPVKVVFDETYLGIPFTPVTGTQMQINGNFPSFSGFVIIDEVGTKYTYGKTTSAIEYSLGFFSQWNDEWIAQAWYLTKITRSDGREITLTYERDDYIHQMYLAVNNDIETRVSIGGGGFSFDVTCTSPTFNGIDDSYDGKLVAPVYLKSINGGNQKIEFIRSTSTELSYPAITYTNKLSAWNSGSTGTDPFLPILNSGYNTDLQGLSQLKFKKLDTIKILNGNGVVERKFAFVYNNISTERLMLRSVREIGKNNETIPSYQFYYDNSVALPDYLANKNDHWGFYNGNEATIVDPSNYYLLYYNKREPNATYLYAGTLNKIVSPTGGVTEYIYEPHVYHKRLYEQRSLGIDLSYNTNTLAGGLRIKKIITYELNRDTVKNTREFFYESAISSLVSSGVLGGRVRYYFDDYRAVAYSNGNVYSNAYFSSQSVLPGCVNAFGSHIGYSLVREKSGDGSYNLYYYSNFDNGYTDEDADNLLQPSRAPYEPYNSLEAERGNLLKEENYSASGVLLRKREISYISLNKSNEYVRSLKCRNFNVCPGLSVQGEEGTAYKIYTYSYLPVEDKITQYDQNGLYPLVVNKFFTYHPTYRLLAKDSAIDSKGQSLITYYRYPFDVLNYTISGTVPNTRPIGYMVQNNIIGVPIEVIRTRKTGSSEIVTNTEVNECKNFHSFVRPYKNYLFKQPSTPLSKSSYSNYSVSLSGSNEVVTKDSRLELRRTYDAYDNKGNVTDYANDQDYKVAYQWDYNQMLSTAKIAIAEPTAGKEYFYQGFEEDITAATANPFAGKRYKLGDYSVPFAAPNGKTYYVNYYSLQGGNWVKITKQFSNYMNLTEGDAIDEVRVYPSDAQIESYTYDPIHGMTSEADVNGNTKLYEYDGLGRLTTIRDDKKNILKQYAYNYQWWQPTGTTQCKTCPSNPSSISNILEVQYKDNNPSSPTYNQTRWVEGGPSAQCVPPALWQNTATPIRCRLNEVNQNSGEREREQRDNNPCSATYNQTKWVFVDVNTSICPVNMTTIMLNSSTTITSGTITFAGTSGTYMFNLYSNGTYNLGSIPGGIYDVTLVVSGTYNFTFGGYGYYGSNNFFSSRPIGGTTFNITVSL